MMDSIVADHDTSLAARGKDRSSPTLDADADADADELLPLLAAAMTNQASDLAAESAECEPMQRRRLRFARRESFMELIRAVPEHALDETAGFSRHRVRAGPHASHPPPPRPPPPSPSSLPFSAGIVGLTPEVAAHFRQLVHRGESLMAAGRWQLALAPLTLALSGMPARPSADTDAAVHIGLRRLVAQCYGRAGMPKDALVHQQRVLQLVTSSGTPDMLWAVLWDLSTAYADPALAAAISGDTNWSLHQAILYLKQALGVPQRTPVQLADAHVRLAKLCDQAGEGKDVSLQHAQQALQLAATGDAPSLHRHAMLDNLRFYLTKALPPKAGPERTELLRRTAGVCLELAAAADLCPPDIAGGHRGRAYLYLAALYDLPGAQWEPNAREKAIEYYTKGCAHLAEKAQAADVPEDVLHNAQRRLAVLLKMTHRPKIGAASPAPPRATTPAPGAGGGGPDQKQCILS